MYIKVNKVILIFAHKDMQDLCLILDLLEQFVQW